MPRATRSSRMLDLHGFLDKYRAEHLHIRKAVELDAVGALAAQATDTIVFENLAGHSEFRLVDNLFVHRRAQARVLQCELKDVVPTLAQVLRRGPKPLKVIDGAACQARVVSGNEVDLAKLPIVRHTDLDPYPYTTSFAVHRHPDSGQFNAMFPRCGVLSPREMVTSFVTPTANRILA